MAYDRNEPHKAASPQQSPGIGGPPPPQNSATWERAVRIVSKFVPATVGLTVLGVGINAALPESIKPTTLMGKFIAEMHVTETLTQQGTVVENTRQMADAQAKAQAMWQMEIISYQHQQQALMDAMQGKIAMANTADVTCTLGPFGIAFFYGPNSYEARNAMQLVQAACDFARRTRQELAAEQAEIARLNSAIMQRQNVGGMR